MSTGVVGLQRHSHPLTAISHLLSRAAQPSPPLQAPPPPQARNLKTHKGAGRGERHRPCNPCRRRGGQPRRFPVEARPCCLGCHHPPAVAHAQRRTRHDLFAVVDGNQPYRVDRADTSHHFAMLHDGLLDQPPPASSRSKSARRSSPADTSIFSMPHPQEEARLVNGIFDKRLKAPKSSALSSITRPMYFAKSVLNSSCCQKYATGCGRCILTSLSFMPRVTNIFWAAVRRKQTGHSRPARR